MWSTPPADLALAAIEVAADAETPTDDTAPEKAAESETRTINCPHCGSKELIHLAELPRTFSYVVREPVQFNRGGAAGAVAASPAPQRARPP